MTHGVATIVIQFFLNYSNAVKGLLVIISD